MIEDDKMGVILQQPEIVAAAVHTSDGPIGVEEQPMTPALSPAPSKLNIFQSCQVGFVMIALYASVFLETTMVGHLATNHTDFTIKAVPTCRG